MPLIAILLLALFGLTVLIPLSIYQRFRSGTARRQGRQWVATLNLYGVAASTLFLLLASALATRWAPETFTYTLAGLSAGAVLGGVGILLTRWEDDGRVVRYTPNRWLVLVVTVVVAARLAYGFWRSWTAWRTSMEAMAWVAASGVAGSMSAGAVVLGYYLVFWAGVRQRIRRHALRR